MVLDPRLDRNDPRYRPNDPNCGPQPGPFATASLSSRAPLVRDDNEETVTMVFPHPVRITRDDLSVVDFPAGIQQVRVSDAEHDYLARNGAYKYDAGRSTPAQQKAAAESVRSVKVQQQSVVLTARQVAANAAKVAADARAKATAAAAEAADCRAEAAEAAARKAEADAEVAEASRGAVVDGPKSDAPADHAEVSSDDRAKAVAYLVSKGKTEAHANKTIDKVGAGPILEEMRNNEAPKV
jgi:hypothetical protein